jgi:hypothetical protein
MILRAADRMTGAEWMTRFKVVTVGRAPAAERAAMVEYERPPTRNLRSYVCDTEELPETVTVRPPDFPAEAANRIGVSVFRIDQQFVLVVLDRRAFPSTSSDSSVGRLPVPQRRRSAGDVRNGEGLSSFPDGRTHARYWCSQPPA